jgi:hypothetical protein
MPVIKNRTNYKLVIIEWEDSQLGYQGWKFIHDQPKEIPHFISVGFLVHEDEKCKILYPHVKNTDDIDEISGSGDIKIPNSAILKLTELTI